MLIELLRNRTLFLFWFLAFGVMLVVDTIAIVVSCYMLKQFGEEWAGTVERGKRRHGTRAKKKDKNETFHNKDREQISIKASGWGNS